ncbi:hypothetical protein C2I36_15405 [Rhodobacteraceae bacterium WD3A24]|nr:hypothetical protein C2I36_15405 [Rhodobacteraceae bacterium WD3A24]
MQGTEFLDDYRRAAACYTEADFDAFFRLAQIDDEYLRSIGKDILCIAGALYFGERRLQEEQVPRRETMRRLNRAKRAAHALHENLVDALEDSSLVDAVSESGVEAIKNNAITRQNSPDTFEILRSIFPVDADGSGFRMDGLTNSLSILAESLDAIDDVMIHKRVRGRQRALDVWFSPMLFYWFPLKEDLPRTGHYDGEASTYGSADIGALTHAAQRLDDSVTERLIVKMVTELKGDFDNRLLEVSFLSSLGVCHLATSKVSTFASKEALAAVFGVPAEVLASLPREHATEGGKTSEASRLSREEFRETLKSSDDGILLLRSIMDLQAK